MSTDHGHRYRARAVLAGSNPAGCKLKADPGPCKRATDYRPPS